MNRKPDVQFKVYGKPAPGGSKRHIGGGRMIDAGKNNKPWRQDVAACAIKAMGGRHPHSGACRVEFLFCKVRNTSDYGTGRNAGKLKPSAPKHWTKRPDALKLSRAVEDAMSGIVYVDDSMIIDEVLMKRFGQLDLCEVKIWFIDDTE